MSWHSSCSTSKTSRPRLAISLRQAASQPFSNICDNHPFAADKAPTVLLQSSLSHEPHRPRLPPTIRPESHSLCFHLCFPASITPSNSPHRSTSYHTTASPPWWRQPLRSLELLSSILNSPKAWYLTSGSGKYQSQATWLDMDGDM